MSVQKQNGEDKVKTSRWFQIIALVLAPLIIAGIYIVGVQIHGLFRYDQAYFAPEYQETYHSPGMVAIALEQVLQNGDMGLYAELTGLKGDVAQLEPKPNLHFSILVDVDERDYFHYMYFDFDTFHRDTRYVKEVNGRWIAVPEDAYFYFDSGQWLKVFGPVAASWWVLLLAVAIMKLLSRFGSRTRKAYGW
ncbi:MAG: hypothetical protein ISS57_14865 [Anaerolineales bacterium]|nr:hypothetical protein [Anaerolineales bacterium]